MIVPTVKVKVKGEQACDKHRRIVVFFVEKQNVWKLETSFLLRFPSLPHVASVANGRLLCHRCIYFHVALVHIFSCGPHEMAQVHIFSCGTGAYIFMWHRCIYFHVATGAYNFMWHKNSKYSHQKDGIYHIDCVDKFVSY